MGWPERLAAMEGKVEAARRTLAEGAPTDTTPLPEADGPLPADLVPRARAVLDATRAVEQAVAQARAAVGEQLRRLRRPGTTAAPGPTPRPPAFFDLRA